MLNYRLLKGRPDRSNWVDLLYWNERCRVTCLTFAHFKIDVYIAMYSGSSRRSDELKKIIKGQFNWVNALCTLSLMIIGCFFVCSAQLYSGAFKWKTQILWVILSCTLYGVIAWIDYRKWLTYAHWVYALSIVALLLTLSPLGKEMNHTKRWLNLYFYYLQPVEFTKLGTLLLVASLLTRSKIEAWSEALWTLLKVILAGLVPFCIVFLQPDLGSALVFPPFIVTLLYLSGLRLRFFLASFMIFVLMASIVGLDIYRYSQSLDDPSGLSSRSFLPLKDYQRKRILVFFAPSRVDEKGIGSNWNLKQSLISIGSGGLTGKGWRCGTQARLGYLPKSVAHNDFIFSVLAEEMGLRGAVLVLGFYALLIFNGLYVGYRASDRFGLFLAAGIATVFMIHVFVNIGMTLRLMPITGIPLPFLSYGGSSLLSSCMMQGLVQSIALRSHGLR